MNELIAVISRWLDRAGSWLDPDTLLCACGEDGEICPDCLA
jgi:hypothetical protein